MKNLLLSIFLLSFSFASAQFIENAPWMQDFNTLESRESATFQDIVDAFDAYWETRDPDVKGSGYKPFKRWETFWKNFVKEDGKLPSAEELFQTWQQKQAQQSRRADDSNWIPIGPFTHSNTGSWSSGQGRVNSIIVDPNNASTYYSGAPAGGIWKSTDAGSTWTVLTDHLPQIGVSGIAIDYANSDIIYIATGDDDAGDSSSVGVWKSTDAGATWNATGLGPGNSPSRMNDIYIHPTNSDILWVATNSGLYKTTNATTTGTWTNKLSGNIRDVKIKPGDPNIIYAVSSSAFYRSTDAGETFSQITNGFPSSSGRLVIDVTPANPNAVFVLSATTGNAFQSIVKSSNSGITFATIANNASAGNIFESTQAWYDMAFAVSDTNENEFYTGVLNIWKSVDGGANMTKVNNWNAPSSPSYSHADIHLLRFYNGELFAGTDGGFYKTSNGGTNFTDLTAGMQIGQFYRLAVSKQSSAKMVGGLQDNGGHALNNNQWQNYYGADGMDTAIDPANSNLYYGFTQNGGSLNISTNAGGSLTGQSGGPASGNWITPLVMNSDSELYAGYSSLYQYNGSWTAISSSFGTNIDFLEIDELDPDNVYVAINNTLRKSTDRGVNFSNVESFSTNITSIEVNNSDSSIVYVTTSGSSQGGVYRSTDGGLSFSDITGSLPSVTKNIIKHQGDNIQNPLYLGTSLGVYRYDDSTGIWEVFENNLPNVSVRDLEINLIDENITAATYGRGIWQSDLATTQLANNDVRLVSVEGINTTTIACGDINPQLVAKNNGLNTITSIDISYTVDGGTPIDFTWNGNLISEAEVTIDIPTLSLTRGSHTFFATTTIPFDQFPGNDSSSTITFNANDLGAVQQVNTFESAQDDLIAYDESATTSLWERGVPTGALLNSASSGTQVYGTNLAGNHTDLTRALLVSQCYDLTLLTGPMLKFNMGYDIETDWDLAYVEYSTDDGANWTLLGTANDPNWYNSSRIAGDGVANNCNNCVGGQWTGTSAALKEYSYDLSAFGTETSIMFRVVFHSDQSVTQEGVIIDDLVVDGTLSNGEFSSDEFSIYPNPSNDVFNINLKSYFEDLKFNVIDVTGKTILIVDDLQPNQNNYSLDLSGLSSGIYFLKIKAENNEVTKKLILN